MPEIWNSVAPRWEANAGFVDGQLALATEGLLDAARIGDPAELESWTHEAESRIGSPSTVTSVRGAAAAPPVDAELIA